MKKILVVAAAVALATFARADMLYWQVNSEAPEASDYSYAKVLYANDYVRNDSQVLTSYINGETSVGTDPAKGVIDATGGLFADLSNVSGITDWTGYQFVVELYGEGGQVLANSGWKTFSNLSDAHAIIEEAAGFSNNWQTMQALGSYSGGWSAGAAPVPEPTSGLLVLIGAALVGLRRKKVA